MYRKHCIIDIVPIAALARDIMNIDHLIHVKRWQVMLNILLFKKKLEQRNLDCPVLVIIKQGLTFKIKYIFLTAGACAPERKGKTARDPNCCDQ